MITAYGDAETKRRALENGAEALLTKPIDFVTFNFDHSNENITLRSQMKLEEVYCLSANFGIQTRNLQT